MNDNIVCQKHRVIFRGNSASIITCIKSDSVGLSVVKSQNVLI